MLLHSRATVVTRATVVRSPSVVRRPSIKPIFSEPVKHIKAKFGRKVPFDHISRPFFCFSKFCIFDFLRIFLFSLTWDHMGEKTSNDISSESAHQIFSQKFIHTPRKGLYQSCIKNCENFKFWIFCNFFLFCLVRLTWKSMRNYTKCYIMENADCRAKRNKIWEKNGTNFWPSSVQGHLGVIQCTCLKIACNSKTAGRRAKWSEIWELGQLLYNIVWFDIVGFKVNLGSFGALISKWPVSRKGLVIERNGVKFGTHVQ